MVETVGPPGGAGATRVPRSREARGAGRSVAAAEEAAALCCRSDPRCRSRRRAPVVAIRGRACQRRFGIQRTSASAAPPHSHELRARSKRRSSEAAAGERGEQEQHEMLVLEPDADDKADKQPLPIVPAAEDAHHEQHRPSPTREDRTSSSIVANYGSQAMWGDLAAGARAAAAARRRGPRRALRLARRPRRWRPPPPSTRSCARCSRPRAPRWSSPSTIPATPTRSTSTTRCSSATTGAALLRPGKEGRLGEPDGIGASLEAAGIPVASRMAAPATVEGGDTVWLDHDTLLVGHGYRTGTAGIAALREAFPGRRGDRVRPAALGRRRRGDAPDVADLAARRRSRASSIRASRRCG